MKIKILMLAGIIACFTAGNLLFADEEDNTITSSETGVVTLPVSEDETIFPEDNDLGDFSEADLKEFDRELLFDLKTATESETAFETFDEAKERERNNRALDPVVEHFQTAFEEKYAGVELSIEPGGEPILYIKGEMTPDMYKQLQALSPDRPIKVVDQRQFSEGQLVEKNNQVFDWLRENGHEKIKGGVDITNNRVQAFVGVEKGEVFIMPADLKEGVEILTGAVVVNDLKAHGGMELWDDDRNYTKRLCTAGFTTLTWDRRRGISTAGHCFKDEIKKSFPNNNFEINVIVHGSTEHDIKEEKHIYSSYGDIGWFSINDPSVHLGPKFYYKKGYGGRMSSRDVDAFKRASAIRKGEYICKYGFTTNYSCATIVDLNNYCGVSRGLVVLDGVQAGGGDSGGPVFKSKTAYGSMTSLCSYRVDVPNNAHHYDTYFTPIERLRLVGASVLTTATDIPDDEPEECVPVIWDPDKCKITL